MLSLSSLAFLIFGLADLSHNTVYGQDLTEKPMQCTCDEMKKCQTFAEMNHFWGPDHAIYHCLNQPKTPCNNIPEVLNDPKCANQLIDYNAYCSANPKKCTAIPAASQN